MKRPCSASCERSSIIKGLIPKPYTRHPTPYAPLQCEQREELEHKGLNRAAGSKADVPVLAPGAQPPFTLNAFPLCFLFVSSLFPLCFLFVSSFFLRNSFEGFEYLCSHEVPSEDMRTHMFAKMVSEEAPALNSPCSKLCLPSYPCVA